MYYLLLLLLTLLALPVMFLICLILLIAQGRPIFFRQKRVGKGGNVFTLYKFRTMVPGAESMQKTLKKMNKANGPVFKMYNDPRYTVMGKFLAHTGLDELPQVYNILRGDMALIGPRPLPVSEEAKLLLWQRKRQEIKPGIISPWIVEGYHSQTFDAWMKSDIAYTKHKSLWYDLHLTVRTVGLLIWLFFRECISRF